MSGSPMSQQKVSKFMLVRSSRETIIVSSESSWTVAPAVLLFKIQRKYIEEFVLLFLAKSHHKVHFQVDPRDQHLQKHSLAGSRSREDHLDETWTNSPNKYSSINTVKKFRFECVFFVLKYCISCVWYPLLLTPKTVLPTLFWPKKSRVPTRMPTPFSNFCPGRAPGQWACRQTQ